MTSEPPVTAVIVMERTSGLSIRNEWSIVSQAIQYKQACKSDTELYMKC